MESTLKNYAARIKVGCAEFFMEEALRRAREFGRGVQPPAAGGKP